MAVRRIGCVVNVVTRHQSPRKRHIGGTLIGKSRKPLAQVDHTRIKDCSRNVDIARAAGLAIH